jgi:carbon-monoxide dehydrogenase medium subunit
MYNFDYHKAKSLAEAAKLLKEKSDPKLLAGGMTLVPTLKQRLASPSDLIDLNTIPDLRGIALHGKVLTVKAMTIHEDVEVSPEVKKAIPALSELAGQIGDRSVRHRGTIGGSIANADPAADYPAAIVGLNATVETTERKITADNFFKGLFETALNPGEIITAVHFPIPDKAGYMKFHHPASGFAVTGVMVSKTGSTVRVAVTGAGPSVFRVPEMEAALAKNFAPDAVANIKVDPSPLMSDIHASADYRAHLVTVMAKRAVAAALA